MREFLTALGIVICLALITAMAGPHFFDWGTRRALFEKRIMQMTGLPARIDGPIAVTLLPTPAISLDRVKIGVPDAGGVAPVEVERIAGALAPMALLRGDFVITEALVDTPKVRIGAEGLGAGASLPLPPARSADPEAVSIEKLDIRDGHIEVNRPGRPPLVVTSLSAELEATSLLGPARGNGSMVMDGARRTMRFSLGKIEDGQGRLKLLVEDHGLLLRLDLDGKVVVNPAEPRFEGVATLTGNPLLEAESRLQLPLRSTAKVTLDRAMLHLDDIAMTVGPEPQPLSLTGSGRLTLAGDPFLDIALTGRSYDFDRPGADGRPRLAVPAELVRQMQGLTGGAGGVALPNGRFDLQIGGVIIGGQTLTGVHVIAEQAGGRLRINTLEAEMPGQSKVGFSRDSLSDDGFISGLMQFQSRDLERLHSWFNGVQRVVTAQIGLRASAVLSSLKDGISIDRVEIDREATHLAGQGSYLLALPGLRPAPRLSLTLQSPRFDIDDIPAFAYGGDRREEKPDLDFALDLEALKLVLDGQETGRLVVKARRDGEIISVERLAITELDGANLIASGTLGGGARRMTLKLDATNMDGILAVGERVLPGAFTRSLRKRAALLSPALLVATLANEDADESYSISAEGHLAETKAKVNGTFSGRNELPVDLNVTFDNADGAVLARQIGSGTRAVHSALPGAIRLVGKGNLRGALDINLAIGLAGLTSQVNGQIKIFQPFAPFEGQITAEARDLGPLATAMEIDGALPMTGAALHLNGRVLSNLAQITITDLRADVGGYPLQGEIAVRLNDNGKVAGQLRVPSVDLGLVAGIATGTGVAPLREARWSTDPFGKPVVPPLRGDLWIEAGKARLNDVVFDGAKFVFRFDDRAVSVEYSEFRLGPARVTGDLLLKRRDKAVDLTSRLKWAGADVSRLLPEGPKGLADGNLFVSGGGDSYAKLAQSLAGTGEVSVRDLRIPAFDPAALARVLTPLTAAPGDALTLTKKLDAELGKAPLAIPQARSSLVVMDGVARVASIGTEGAGLRTEASGTVDLGRLTLDLRVTATAGAVPQGWRGALPQFTVQWLGGLTAPRRSLGVETLLNGILATSLHRDSEALEQQQQDVRERILFNRRLRSSEQERARAEEEAKAEALRRQNEALRRALDPPVTGGQSAPLNLLPPAQSAPGER